MEEIDKSSSTSVSPRSIHSYHHGNGTLRGGGVQKIYHNGPTFKAFKRKLDYRLGYCTLGCLITISIVLTIFGLFHEIVYEEVTRYIDSTRQLIVNSILATLSPDITTTDSNALLDEIDDSWVDEFDRGNYTAIPLEMLSGNEDSMKGKENSDEFEDSEMEIISSPYKEPNTCLGFVDVNPGRCLVATELDQYYEIFLRSHIALWNLNTVNFIVALLLAPFIYISSSKIARNQSYKIFHRVILFLVLFFMASQLIVLINPLLYSSYMYPIIIDRLFIEKLPREQRFIKQVESRFGCQFDYISQLVELNFQKPCIPRIKSFLLLPYTVILLIIIDLLPFLFIFFTYAWDKWLKNSLFCRTARERIEINNQRRPQSREDILKKTMEEPHYV